MCTLKSIGLAFNYLSYQPSNFPYLGFKKHSYYMQQIFFCTYGWRRLKLLLHIFIWFAESDHYICASMLSGFESSFSELWDMVKLKILWLHDNVVVFECLLVDWRDTNTSYYCVILPSYLVYWVYSAPFIFHSLIVIISSLVTGSPPLYELMTSFLSGKIPAFLGNKELERETNNNMRHIYLGPPYLRHFHGSAPLLTLISKGKKERETVHTTAVLQSLAHALTI